MKNILLTTAMCFSISISFSQEWKEKEPSTLFAVDENEDTANVKVGIGTQTPAEKLHVIGNLKVQGKIIADSMNISGILPPVGDSIIRLGTHTININTNANRISWTPTFPFVFCPPSSFSAIEGLAIGNGTTIAIGNNSMAFGTNTSTGCNAANSIVMGSGITNNLSNTFMLGYGNTAIFADATRVGIFTTGPTQTLDVNGTANIRTVTQNNSLTQVLVRDPANLGLIQWRDATTLVASNAWVLGGNLNATSFDKLGATTLGTNLNIYAGSNTQQSMFIDGGLSPATFGNVGIGTNFTNAQQRLDVDGGNIDVNTPQLGYMIGDQYVLIHKGDVRNIFVGVGAGAANTFGTNNTFIGNDAGLNNTTGSDNTYIGYQVQGVPNLTNASAIGANAKVSASNSLILGGTGEHAVKVGIGTTAPQETLDVNGTARIASLACENCLVMTDASGKLYAAENKIAELEARIKALEEKKSKLYAFACK